MKTRAVAVFVSTLCATGLLAAPAGAATERIGGFVVTWPSAASLTTIQPGDAVRVSLAPSARARAERRVATVTLSRITRSGKHLVVARHRLRSGSRSATLPRDGLYRLKVTAHGRFVQRTFEVLTEPPPVPCALDEDYAVELEISSEEVQPLDELTVTLTNVGTSCVGVDHGLSWQVLRGDQWHDVSFGVVYPAIVQSLQPGQSQVQQATVPRNTPPGLYRVVKNFANGDVITDEITVRP